jgi:hypothetical protein
MQQFNSLFFKFKSNLLVKKAFFLSAILDFFSGLHLAYFVRGTKFLEYLTTSSQQFLILCTWKRNIRFRKTQENSWTPEQTSRLSRRCLLHGVSTVVPSVSCSVAEHGRYKNHHIRYCNTYKSRWTKNLVTVNGSYLHERKQTCHEEKNKSTADSSSLLTMLWPLTYKLFGLRNHHESLLLNIESLWISQLVVEPRPSNAHYFHLLLA